MSTAIVKHDPTLSSLADVRAVAEQFALSAYFDAKGSSQQQVAQILTKIMAGRELGYGPFASVNGIHVISGKPSVSANMMAAAVKASGRYDYRVRRIDDAGVEIEFFEYVGGKRESLGVSTFTREDANKAGTQNLQKYARNMMFARAMSNGVKWYCPDVFNGSAVYVPEELGAEVDGEGNMIDVAPTPAQPAQVEQSPVAIDRPKLQRAFMAYGAEAFGADWNDARHWLIERYTTKITPDDVRTSTKDLTDTELSAMFADMQKWNGQLVTRWQAHRDAQRAELDAISVATAEEVPA